MDILLIAVTGVSFTLAAGMGVLLARMIREDRLRAEARVQLLEQLAVGGPSDGARTDRLRHGSGEAADVLRAEADVLHYNNAPRVHRPRPRAAKDVNAASRPPAVQDFSPASVTLHRTDLFHEEPEPSPWPRRLAVIGSLAAVLALGIFGWTQMRGPAAATAAAEAAPASLELLSLRHAREGNTLTITGLVQNPAGAAALANVQATVFVFGPGGTFLTSGRAPLDFTSLAAGDESPFVVKIPVSGQISRYRVGFRGADDRVVGHVDRRTDQLGRNF